MTDVRNPTAKQIDYAYELTRIPREQLQAMDRGQIGELTDRARNERKPDAQIIGSVHDLTDHPIGELERMTRQEIYPLLEPVVALKGREGERMDAIQRAVWEKKFPVGCRIRYRVIGHHREHHGHTAIVLAHYRFGSSVRWDTGGTAQTLSLPEHWELVEVPNQATLALATAWEQTSRGTLAVLAQQTDLPFQLLRDLTEQDLRTLRHALDREKELATAMRRHFRPRTHVQCMDPDSPHQGKIGVVVAHEIHFCRTTVRFATMEETSFPHSRSLADHPMPAENVGPEISAGNQGTKNLRPRSSVGAKWCGYPLWCPKCLPEVGRRRANRGEVQRGQLYCPPGGCA